MRRTPVVAAVCSVLLAAPIAEAQQDTKQTCSSAYEEGQRLQHRGALLEARTQLLVCRSLACPQVMHPYCELWLSQVEASLSTIVFQVVSEMASDVSGAWASVDGAAPVLLRGRAVELDPGEHELRFMADGYEPTNLHYSLAEGQKLRRETVVMKPIRRRESSTSLSWGPHRRPFASTPFWVAGAVGATGLASFVYFGLAARAGDHRLAGCTPGCDPHDVDAVRRDYLFANVALGVGAAGLVVAGVIFAMDLKRPAASSARVLQIGLSPVAIGPVARLSF